MSDLVGHREGCIEFINILIDRFLFSTVSN